MFGFSKKILIVDDERDLVDAVGAILKSWGKISIKKASSVTEAINVLKEDKIDLILTDVNMYGPSGYDLINYAYGKFPDIPIILMSGKVNIYDDRECSEEIFHHIYAFFEKPFDYKELKETVEKALLESSKKAS